MLVCREHVGVGGALIAVWTEPRKLKKRKLGVLYVEQQPKVLII